MLRRVLCVAAVIGLLTTVALAADEGFKATIKKIDADKNTITVAVDGKETTYDVAKDADIFSQGKGKQNKPGPKEPISGGLSSLKVDAEVTITTIKKADKDVVVSIKLEGMRKKKTDK